MLNAHHLPRYLISKDLLSADAIIRGSCSITPIHGRNCNFRIRDGGPGFMVKQATWVERDQESIRNEIGFYRSVAPLLSSFVQERMPRLLLGDCEECVIVTELVEPSITMFDVFRASHQTSTENAQEVGRLLGHLHSSKGLDLAHREIIGLSEEIPWGIRVHLPTPTDYTIISPGAYHCLKALQHTTPLCSALERARELWHKTSIIHGDIKSDNLLNLQLTVIGTSPRKLFIVDWELAQWGDPAWDVAGFFNDVLVYWLFSIPLECVPSVDAARASQLIPSWLHEVARAFIESYVTVVPAAETSAILERGFFFTGARLVQFAVEYSQSQGEFSPRAELAIKLAHSLMTEPGWAEAALCGSTFSFACNRLQ